MGSQHSNRGKPPPPDVERILHKPGRLWTPDERERVFEWFMKEKLDGLVGFAYARLNMTWEHPEDMVMDALVNAIHFLRTFDPTKGSFLHWLYVIVWRHCRRVGSREEVRQQQEVPLEVPDADGNLVPRALPDPAGFNAEQWGLQTSMQQHINRLPEPYRKALLLYHMHEQSMKEIAQQEDISEDNAKVHVFWARHMLRRLPGKIFLC